MTGMILIIALALWMYNHALIMQKLLLTHMTNTTQVLDNHIYNHYMLQGTNPPSPPLPH